MNKIYPKHKTKTNLILKKINAIIAILTMVVFIQSCTKKETIIESYNPPAVTLYGTWKEINTNPSNLSTSYYIIDKTNDFAYNLIEDEYGFRNSNGYAVSASDKQITLGGTLYNYTVKNDTLKLKYDVDQTQTFVKVPNPTFTFNNWTNNISINKSITAPLGINSSRSFGFNGDFLYFYRNTFGNKSYKYNTLNSSFVDSGLVANTCANYYRNGNLYYGFTGTNKLFKGNELLTGSAISINNLNTVYALSINGTSNTIYAYQSNRELYAGTDGGNFSLLTDLNTYNTRSVVYYGNDEFLTIKNSRLYKIKISPTFKVTTSYTSLPNYSFYTVSTNGSDVWVYAYNDNIDNYEFLKLNLN